MRLHLLSQWVLSATQYKEEDNLIHYDLIHCSMVSSKTKAFLDEGNSKVPGSGKYIGFSSNVLWQGDKLAEAKKKTRKSVRSKNSNNSWPTLKVTFC